MVRSTNILVTYCLSAVLALVVSFVYLAVPGDAAEKSGAGGGITVLASGLHNPRGLNFAPDGSLWVTEAAGNGVAPSPCGVMGDGSTKCLAYTGSVTRIDVKSGQNTRIFTGLPSLISPIGNGSGGTGVHDISFQGLGNAYVTSGFGANPLLRQTYFGAHGENFARLLRLGPKIRLLEDLGEYEAVVNPDGNAIDANPYGLLARPGKVVYTDAGGNSLNQIAANGRITTLAVFPDRAVTLPNGSMTAVQAVPTSVVVGPNGDYYVGQLTGGPFLIGAANVYRVPARGGMPVVAYTGFTNIIDIAFGPDGSLYVLEIARDAIPNFNPGRLVRIAPSGARTEIAAGILVAPGGIAVRDDGVLYVTNMSTSSTLGQVLRIEL